MLELTNHIHELNSIVMLRPNSYQQMVHADLRRYVEIMVQTNIIREKKKLKLKNNHNVMEYYNSSLIRTNLSANSNTFSS